MFAEREVDGPNPVVVGESELDRMLADRSEVLYSLVDLKGRPVGKELVSRVLTSAERVVVFGEPAANKSTILGQLVREVTILSGGRIAPTVVLFDQVLVDCQLEFGKPRQEWGTEEWDRFDRWVEKRIEEPAEGVGPSRRHVRFVEIVGLRGKGVPNNRAVTTLENLARRARQEPEDAPKTLIVAVAPDSRSQYRTGIMRERVLSVQPEEVLGVLRCEFNIEPVGLSETDAYRAGVFLQEKVRSMARAEDIGRIRSEMLCEARSWSCGLSAEEFAAIWRLFDLIRMPVEVGAFKDNEFNEYQLKAAHLGYIVWAKLGLGQHQGFVVFSLFQEHGTIHWPIQLDTLRGYTRSGKPMNTGGF
ncbi:MAG: hypothetical protein HYU80_02780 [Candidatus Blackburnbacteria bacterium]|nr:hypothetical protein [Candidatus Blackburnbacteria bacterium]